MKSLIIGLGKSGISAYQLLEKEGDEVIGVDDNIELMRKLCGIKTAVDPEVEKFDRVVVSPGIPKTNRFYRRALELKKEVVGEADLGLSRLKQPCVAITGTNGKTTVTLMVEHVLLRCGKKAKAIGNVGLPLTAYQEVPGEILVVELSSFQLETLKGPIFEAGVVLNITPDHLDRYENMEEYGRTKCHLQRCMKPSGTFWVHESVERDFKELLEPSYKVYTIETIGAFRYRNRAIHERDNVLAAMVLCETFGILLHDFSTALETFQKPSHRIEFVATIEGVDYFNDSKGTNIDATIKAVVAMKNEVILIAGGVDKGASYKPWKEFFLNKVKRIIVLGQAAEKITGDLEDDFVIEHVATLQEAVMKARALAEPGDTILLSPGCSSYDMFRDYAHRGDEFKKLVLEVQK